MKHTENLGKLSDMTVTMAEDVVKVVSAGTGAAVALAQTLEAAGLYAKGEMICAVGEAFSSEERQKELKTGTDALDFLKTY